jgi:hypothetical protein
MCLYPTTGILRSEADFYTFKVLIDVFQGPTAFMSPYKQFFYSLGETYHKEDVLEITQEDNPDGSRLIIEKGFHSYLITDQSKLNDMACMDYPENLILCKIPEGSKYARGKHQDVVTDTIQPIEVFASFEKKNNPKIQLTEWTAFQKLLETALDFYTTKGLNFNPQLVYQSIH